MKCVLDLAADIQESDAAGTEKPLVEAVGVKVATQIMEIYVRHADRLCAVNGGEDAGLSGEVA